MPKKGFTTINELLSPEDQQAPEADLTSKKKSINTKIAEVAVAEMEDETQRRAKQLSLAYINLFGFPIGAEVISLIDEEMARQNQCVTFFREENEIRLGVVDPDNPALHDLVSQLQYKHDNARVLLYLISPHSFESAVKLYKNVAKVKTREYGVNITAEQLQKLQKEIKTFDELEKRLRSASMTDAFSMIISSSLNADASDVHLEAEEHAVVVRFRIDGVLHNIATLPLNIWPRLVARVKVLSGMKVNISDVPQDGRITVNFPSTKKDEEEKLDIRVSALPSAFGESVVFRLLKPSTIGLEFEDLGMRPVVFKKLQTEIEKPNGMILTTGPTGSGKTTTLYAILNKLNNPETKIITLENPIEYKLKGIVQSQVEHSHGYDFSRGLRAILRQDPDIVMVGEIRDLETATTAVEAALTGHLMLSTIHTNDASGAIPRLLGIGVRGIFLAPAINAVIGQRLVRRICQNCKIEYTPGHEELTKMKEWIKKIPPNSGEEQPDAAKVKFYRGRGCDKCAKTGFKGRVGIYEVFTMSPELEQEVLSGNVSEFKMKEILYAAGMVTMGQDGILKVVEGITTLDEIFRVAKE